MTLKGLEEARRVVEMIQPSINEAGYGIDNFDLNESWGYINMEPTNEKVTHITVSIVPLKYSGSR
jgi:hypothetical protein